MYIHEHFFFFWKILKESLYTDLVGWTSISPTCALVFDYLRFALPVVTHPPGFLLQDLVVALIASLCFKNILME